MSPNARIALTLIAVVLIGGAIILIDSQKASPVLTNTGSAEVMLATSSAASASTTPAASADAAARIAAKQKLYPLAKEIVKPSGFVNTDPLTIQSLIGKKVILVDFWTYSCINCIRTLPYVESWYEKYKDDGLVVIGVHTPEFGFEKVLANVQAAVTKYGITYPVVLDNDYGTWSAYGNQYWPHEYLIDIDGFIADDHIGEGDYAATEAEIQKLLAERKQVLGASNAIPSGVVSPKAEGVTTFMPLSPETYFGSNRNTYFGNGVQGIPSTHTYTLPATLSSDTFYLGGTWDIEPEYATANTAGATIAYAYEATHLYVVGAGQGATMKVLIDGKPIPASMRGADVDAQGLLHLSGDGLYRIVNDSAWGQHRLDLILQSGSVTLYTFTFG